MNCALNSFTATPAMLSIIPAGIPKAADESIASIAQKVSRNSTANPDCIAQTLNLTVRVISSPPF